LPKTRIAFSFLQKRKGETPYIVKASARRKRGEKSAKKKGSNLSFWDRKKYVPPYGGLPVRRGKEKRGTNALTAKGRKKRRGGVGPPFSLRALGGRKRGDKADPINHGQEAQSRGVKGKRSPSGGKKNMFLTGTVDLVEGEELERRPKKGGRGNYPDFGPIPGENGPSGGKKKKKKRKRLFRTWGEMGNEPPRWEI